jgi:hypothetical protein
MFVSWSVASSRHSNLVGSWRFFSDQLAMAPGLSDQAHIV